MTLQVKYALTGCDTTSKISTKSRALKTAITCGDLLKSFGKDEISDQMLSDAEQFLVKCVSSSKSHFPTSFDELRYEIYHNEKFTFDLEKLPPTSTSIKQHILRAYIQCKMWFDALSEEDTTLDPVQYGYTVDEDGHVLPNILSGPSVPDEFPVPCNCLKCSMVNVCPCRVRKIPCCQFCKCGNGPACKNPSNSTGTD